MRFTKGFTSSWAILIVIAFLAAAMLYGLWPTGKTFEQATGLEELQQWHKLKEFSEKVIKRGSEEVARTESSSERVDK